MVGDDALVTSFVGEGDMPQVQDGGVLHHASTYRIRCAAVVVSAHMGVVLCLGMAKQFLVLAPRKRHGGGAAARGRTGETHVTTKDRHRGFWLHCNLGLGKVI